MRIVLARHGESTWQQRENRTTDCPLTPVGHRQARLLSTWLLTQPWLDQETRLKIDIIRTSPLRRASQTATHIAEALRLPVEIDPDLAEADFYVPDHLPRASEPFGKLSGCTPSYEAFRQQAAQALRRLVEDSSSGCTVLAVAHGGLIKTALRIAAGSDQVCFRLYNAGLTIIEWRSGRWHLTHLNLLEHLPLDMRTH